MILTKDSAPQKKTQLLSPSDALKVSSKYKNTEVLRSWCSTIFKIQKSHFLHSQTFSDIDLVRLIFLGKRARNKSPSI